MTDERRETIMISSMDEIPQFASEADEAEYWYTHELSDELIRQRTVTERPAWLSSPRAESGKRGHAS